MGSVHQLRDVLLISPVISKGVSSIVPTPVTTVTEWMNVNTQMLQLSAKDHGCVPVATKCDLIIQNARGGLSMIKIGPENSVRNSERSQTNII